MANRQATENLESRLKANPESLVFPRLAAGYLDRGETDRAIETCLKGVNLHPFNTSGRIVLGRCFMKKDRFEEAIGVFAEVCRLDERNVMAMKVLGDLFARHGSRDLAGDLYRLAARIDPFNASIATIAARAIGSGKTDLLDIIEEGVADAKTLKTAGAAPIEKSVEAGPAAVEVLETVEVNIDAPPEASEVETFDTVEVAESEPIVAEVAGETGLGAVAEPLRTVAAELSEDAPSAVEPVEIVPLDVQLKEEGTAAGSTTGSELVVEAEPPEAVPAQTEAPTATDAALQPLTPPGMDEIPSGREISSRLDTLFGEESPASRGSGGVTAVPRDAPVEDLFAESGTAAIAEETTDRLIIVMPEETTIVNDRAAGAAREILETASAIPEEPLETLIIDEPGESSLPEAPAVKLPPGEHEELFLDSRDELLVELGENRENPAPPDSRDAESLIIDSPPVTDAPRSAPARQAGRQPPTEPAFGGLELATPTLAEIYFKQGQLQQALAIYRRLLEKEPGNVRLQRQVEAVEAAIASGGEGIASLEQERGKASRKPVEEPAGSSPAAPPAAEAASGPRPKAKTNFKWIKKPNDKG